MSHGRYNIYELLNALMSYCSRCTSNRINEVYAFEKEKVTPMDKSKYCKSHYDYGHETNNYVTLKDKIEDLIWWRHLPKYKKFQMHVNKEGKCDKGACSAKSNQVKNNKKKTP